MSSNRLSLLIGVSSLTLAEIRSDIRSILSSKALDNNHHIHDDNYLNHDAADNETDSDSSIKSDEILDSEYPVQPRNISKSDRVGANDFRYNENNNNNNIYSTTTNIDGALFYLDDIRRHRSDLYEGERLREELEQCSLVIIISHA